MIESSVGSRLTALNVGRSGATSRSSQSRVTANGGATATLRGLGREPRCGERGVGGGGEQVAQGAGLGGEHEVRVVSAPSSVSTRQRCPSAGAIVRAGVAVRTTAPCLSRYAAKGAQMQVR